MKPASCKAKGRLLQNWVCEQIRELFGLSEADVKPAIMGESGMDIKLSDAARQCFGYAAECKNTEKLNLWDAWAQAVINAEKEQLTPILFVKRNRSTPLVVMDARAGLALITELYEKDHLIHEA